MTNDSDDIQSSFWEIYVDAVGEEKARIFYERLRSIVQALARHAARRDYEEALMRSRSKRDSVDEPKQDTPQGATVGVPPARQSNED